MSKRTEAPAAYRLTHVPSGYFYIGSSAFHKSRLAEHKSFLNSGNHHNRKFQSVYTRWEDIEVELFPTATIGEARDCEQGLLDEFLGTRLCCNIGTDSVDLTAGVITSEMRRANLRRATDSWRGSKHTEESKARISLGANREPRGDDTRLKISLAKSRKVCADGIEYDSASAAASELEIPVRTVRSRIYSESPSFKNWFFI